MRLNFPPTFELWLQSVMDSGYKIQDSRYWKFDAGYFIQDTGYKIQDALLAMVFSAAVSF
jgi:hypothetical protein